MPAITDIPGILVGHAHDAEALTGVTVLLTKAGAVAGVDVRGGAPGTRETDLLRSENSVQAIHGVALCGGSAMGLAAADGVMRWLREQDVGFDYIGLARIPIVPAAVIFDLNVGRHDRFPEAEMGYAAAAAAANSSAEGCIGAGMGAAVGKILGMGAAMKGGLGTWSERLPDGTLVGALVVVNAWGDVWEEHGGIIAGARDRERGVFLDAQQLLRTPEVLAMLDVRRPAPDNRGNTTIAVVATDATLTKPEANKLAQMAHDGLARTIRPVHTPFDGDTVFALATGLRRGAHLTAIGSVAADVLARAVERAVRAATSMGGLPAARELG